MGNSCPNGRHGFLQSVSAAVMGRDPASLPPPPAPPSVLQNSNAIGDSTAADNPPEAVNLPNDAPSAEPSSPLQKKKPKHLKRVCSAGLMADSVLQRRTGRVKDMYSIGRKLGQGQFGTTYFCIEKATGKEFACKSIAKRKLLTQEDVDDVRREIQIMHHLSGHPNVISIIDAYEDAVAVHVVMELCVGGELFDRIIQRGHYSEKKAAELTRVIVGVIEVCHSMGVMHRDLKPENFLFVNLKEESPLRTIDFGLSIFFKPGETFSDVVGSPFYVAPEVLLKQYGPEADVWSAGIIVYILLSGVPPFWDETEQGIFEQVLKGELDFMSEPWPHISESAKDLVRKMLVRDSKKRLTAHQVLCHPWVQVDGVAPDKPLDSAVLSRLKQFSAMNKLKKLALRSLPTTIIFELTFGMTSFKALYGRSAYLHYFSLVLVKGSSSYLSSLIKLLRSFIRFEIACFQFRRFRGDILILSIKRSNSIADNIFLKVSPMCGVTHFGKGWEASSLLH